MCETISPGVWAWRNSSYPYLGTSLYNSLHTCVVFVIFYSQSSPKVSRYYVLSCLLVFAACLWVKASICMCVLVQSFQNGIMTSSLINYCPSQCTLAQSVSLASLDTMSPCPVCTTPKLMVSWVSAGDEARCPGSNAPTPSSPPRMGLYITGSLPNTSCWGRQLEMCPSPSWMLSRVMLMCTVAGSRSQGCSMTISSTHT